MSKILIDLYKSKEPYSGLGQFSINFARALVDQFPNKDQLDLLIHPSSRDHFKKLQVPLKTTSLLKRYFPEFNGPYALWHSLNQFPSFLPPKRSQWILTIHDLNFLIEKSGLKKEKYLSRLQKNVDRADYLTTISHYSKGEIEKHLNTRGKQIHVIYNGVLDNSLEGTEHPSFLIEEKFFFSIGIFNRKKNFEVLLPLMKRFPNHKLVLAGNCNTAYGNELRNMIEQQSLQDQVLLPGKVSNKQKNWLYSNCEALLFPSLAEGFGLPVIEALNYGKPVFLSSHTALPEIGGDVAFYFSDFEPESMSELIKSKLEYVAENEAEYRRSTIEHAGQFSWERCISAYIKLYEEALGR